MIGIDISEQSIKVVQVDTSSHRHQLQSYAWQEVPAGFMVGGVVMNVAGMQEVVRKALAKAHCAEHSTVPVVASIPEAESFLRVIEIPKMQEAEVTEAIHWELAQHIPFSLDTVYIDWQAVHSLKQTSTDRREVLVGAAEKRVVDPLHQLLSSIGLDVAALELESQAIIRALISPELQLRKGLLVVDLGGSSTNVIVHDRGTIRFTASLRRGASDLTAVLSVKELEAMAGPLLKDPGDNFPDMAKKLKEGLDGIVAQIHGIVEFYTGLTPDNQVNEILLTGGGSNLPGLDQSFLQYFDDVHVQRGNPWVNVLPAGQDVAPPMGLYQSVHFSTALGLAMRSVTI